MQKNKNLVLSNNKIDSLQALRALAVLGIFLIHANSSIEWATLGVSVFLVLSGFLMVYKYSSKPFDVSLKNNALFSINKIKKLYPLHIITMLLLILQNIIVIVLSEINLKHILSLVVKIGFNVTLLQTWVPNQTINFSLNGVAWYLSVMMFIYFMFPYILNIINKLKISVLSIICICVIIFQIVTCIPFLLKFGEDSQIYSWFMYCFPIFRLGDFFVGGCLGKLFLNLPVNKIGKIKATICEVIVLVLTIAVCLWMKQEQSNVFLKAVQNKTTVFIPLAVIWVYMFAVNRGVLTNLLSNKFLIYLGNISSYFFLIHSVITQYQSFIFNLIGIEYLTYVTIIKVIIIVVEFIVSILLSILYKRIEKRCKWLSL